MPIFRAGDIPALLRKFGVDVTLGATTVKGLVDREDDRILEGDGTSAAMLGPNVVVTVQTGALPGLDSGSALVVDGVSWVVTSLAEIQDGAFTKLYVRMP